MSPTLLNQYPNSEYILKDKAVLDFLNLPERHNEHHLHKVLIGKMDMYLEALDRDIKRDNENPSIGIILCPSADRSVVVYA